MMSYLDFLTEMNSDPVVSQNLFGSESTMEKSKVLGSLIIPDPLYMSTGQIGMKPLPSMTISTIRLDYNIRQVAGLEELHLNKLLLFAQNLCYQLLNKLLKIYLKIITKLFNHMLDKMHSSL